MAAETGTFMSIGEVMGVDSKSFEEVRIKDYIKAYQATGRPPLPCPQEPTDELQRKALNLPPLFQPFTPSSSYLSGLRTDSPKPMAIVKPEDIPAAQEFRLPSLSTEKYHAISCMTEYENFSHEELRYYAYVRGHIKPPIPVAMDPFVLPSSTRETIAVPNSGVETLENICAQPAYDKHSPEVRAELRIAFLLHGRQLTSAELLQTQSPSAPTTLTPPAAPWLTSTPLPSATSAPSAIPQPIFAASPPAPSKFTFGLR